MVQTAVTVNPGVGFRGLIADGGPDHYIRSYANGSAGDSVFGIMVRPDATNPESQFEALSATGQVPLGVLVHQHDIENPELGGLFAISIGETAGVMRRGRIWVPVEEAVTAYTSDVFFRHTAGGGGSEIGVFRTDADTASADQLNEAQWVSSTAGAGLAILEINLP